MEKRKNILILMTGPHECLGDNVMKTCILEPISENFPKSKMYVYAKHPAVFLNNPFIHKVYGVRDLRDIPGIKKLISKNNIGTVINLCAYPYPEIEAISSGANNVRFLKEPLHRIFRNRLKKIFNIEDCPVTDGDIPVVFTKVDEFVFGLKLSGLRIRHRYLSKIFTSKSAHEIIERKLRAAGWDTIRPAFVLCESAGCADREWGVGNYAKLARMLADMGFEIIVSTDDNRPDALAVYKKAGCPKGRLVHLKTSLEEYFALLDSNRYFRRNAIAGVVAGDTGSLHTAAALHRDIDGICQPIVVCLGHDSTSGDIRYSDPGSVYVAKLKKRTDAALERLASSRVGKDIKSKLRKLLSFNLETVSIDRPLTSEYLVAEIDGDISTLPVYTGKQIYEHTLLRDILKKSLEPVSTRRAKAIYRRMDPKKIKPSALFKILMNLLSQRETSFKSSPKNGFVVKTGTAMRIEAEYIGQVLGRVRTDKIPEPYYYRNFKGSNAMIVFRPVSGKNAFQVWKKFSEKSKTSVINDILDILKRLHSEKHEHFGKLGMKSNLLFSNFFAYLCYCIDRNTNAARKTGILNVGDICKINLILKKIERCFSGDAPSFVHHDVHLKNIIVHGNHAKGLVDFEYFTFAPIDYELDTLLRSFEEPHFYYGRNSGFIKNDRELILDAVRDKYPALMRNAHLKDRLNVYSLKFYLDLLVMNKMTAICRRKIKDIFFYFGVS